MVLTVTAGSFLMSPTYEATSKILLKFGRENVYTPTTPAGGGSPLSWTCPAKSGSIPRWRCSPAATSRKRSSATSGWRRSIRSSWKSRSFSFGASAKLSPSDRALLVFQKKLAVEAVKKSNIIDIRFQHKDPAVAARVVNNLVAVFLEHHISVYKESGGYGFFIEQVNLWKKSSKTRRKSSRLLKAATTSSRSRSRSQCS